MHLAPLVQGRQLATSWRSSKSWTRSIPGGEEVILVPSGKKFPTSFQSTGILLWQDEKNFIRLERSKGSDGKISMLNRILVEVYKNGREAAVHYIDVPEQPVVLVAVRKGGSLRLLFALPPKQLAVFHEMAVDFNKDVFVGLAAANLSKRPFQAKLSNFSLKSPGGRADIVAEAGQDDKADRHRHPEARRTAPGVFRRCGA